VLTFYNCPYNITILLKDFDRSCKLVIVSVESILCVRPEKEPDLQVVLGDKWFSATFLYYVCDQAAMHINHKYLTPLVSSSAVTGGSGSRMLILKVKRPVLFNFKPGQYAFLRLAEIDQHWHPFSIASGPDSSFLEFYIEVFPEESWTGKLWKMLEAVDETSGGSFR
jgi:hypothetical protein